MASLAYNFKGRAKVTGPPDGDVFSQMMRALTTQHVLETHHSVS